METPSWLLWSSHFGGNRNEDFPLIIRPPPHKTRVERQKGTGLLKRHNLIGGTKSGVEYYIPEFNLEDQTKTEDLIYETGLMKQHSVTWLKYGCFSSKLCCLVLRIFVLSWAVNRFMYLLFEQNTNQFLGFKFQGNILTSSKLLFLKLPAELDIESS